MNRLVQFQNDPERVSRYKEAIKLLQAARIDELLINMGLPVEIDAAHPQSLHMNAYANQQRVGYHQAIENLFNLDVINTEEFDRPIRDYGARDKLVAEGTITPKEREELDRDE